MTTTDRTKILDHLGKLETGFASQETDIGNRLANECRTFITFVENSFTTEDNSALQAENAELIAKHNNLMERSVGAMAMAIAEGDEDYEKVPLDCPMLVAVRMVRDNYNLAHKELGAYIVRCGELQSQLETSYAKGREDGIANAVKKTVDYNTDLDAIKPDEYSAQVYVRSRMDAKKAIQSLSDPKPEPGCEWQYSNHGMPHLSCGCQLGIGWDKPNWKHCPYCGKPIKEPKQ